MKEFENMCLAFEETTEENPIMEDAMPEDQMIGTSSSIIEAIDASESAELGTGGITTHSAYSANCAETIGAWDNIIRFEPENLPAFPVEALPTWLANYVAALAGATETPADLAAMLCLGTCAAAIAKRRSISGSPSWTEPSNLYVIVALPPASRKSVVYNQVTSPLKKYQNEVNKERLAEITKAMTKKDLLEQKLAKAKKDAMGAEPEKAQEAEQEVVRLAIELSQFRLPGLLKLVADDVTPEQLATLLAEQEGRMAIMSPEGGIFDTIAGRYSGSVPNLDVFLKGHSGDEITVDRVGRASDCISDPALTMVLAIQPEVLRGLANKPGFRGRGLLARFIFSLPPDNIGYRSLKEVPIPEAVDAAYQSGIRQLLDLQPLVMDGQPHPLLLSLDAPAAERFQQFRASVEKALRPDHTLGDFRDWGGKFAGAVLRIAGVLQVCNRVEATIVTLETMQSAIAIGEYLAEHMKAAFGLMGSDATQGKASAILAWIRRNPVPSFSKRDAFCALRATFQKADTMDGPLEYLRDHNYLREAAEPRQEKKPGRKPSPVFEVNPALLPAHNTHNTHIILTASVKQQGQAHEVAKARQRGKETRNPLGDIGTPDGNYEADYYGALAEIVISDWMTAQGVEPRTVLVTRYYMTKPDMNIQGRSVEIKCSPPGKIYVHLSERQHSNEARRPQHYLIACFETLDVLTLSTPIPYEQVCGWERWEGGHEPCYRIRRTALPRLKTIQELLES